MIRVRPSAERGHERDEWHEAFFSFAFGSYEGERLEPIVVLNEDAIEGSKGFPMHAHHDMEIFTWVGPHGVESWL